MKLKHYLSIFVIAAFIAFGCKGDQGDPGTNGLNGVSNITSTYYTVFSNSWLFGSNQWYFNTGQVVPNGDGVMVYWAPGGSTGYSPLPATGVYTAGDQLTYVYGSSTGLTVWYSNSFSFAPNTTINIEVVDFPPALYVKYPNVNWKNYSEVAALPEFQAVLHK